MGSYAGCCHPVASEHCSQQFVIVTHLFLDLRGQWFMSASRPACEPRGFFVDLCRLIDAVGTLLTFSQNTIQCHAIRGWFYLYSV